MNTDDPHLKCHLMSQNILHICPHHHVVVLKLRCRRSCHNANENLRNDGTAQSVVNEVIPRERSGRPDVDPQREERPHQFVIGNDETELELSVESRSFVNRVNDQVRKRQKRISNVTEDGEKHSMI